VNSLLSEDKVYDRPLLGSFGAASKVKDKVAVFGQGLRSTGFDTNVV
jgi:hypothetical protein